MSSKFIIVVGGVISGTGKGVAGASIGMLLKQRGHSVQAIKFDPYLNVNAGVLSPREHGEVFLCDDGSETDLDLGTYERVIGIEVSSKNILTSGTLYRELFKEEEDGKYLGTTVQVIPHLTDKIQDRLIELGKSVDIVICEIGGTVGDLESEPYFRAIRQFKQKNYNDVLIALVAPILWIPTIKEFKTKPFQSSVEKLQSYGIQPDMLLCRIDREIPNKMLDKIAHLTNVPREAVFDAPDVKTIYQVPIELYDRHVDDFIADRFHLKRNGCRIHKYRELVEKYVGNINLPSINIGIVAKYDTEEAYLSLKEAIYHAAVANEVKAELVWINAKEIDQAKDMRGVWKYFENIDGVIVPGGFDVSGIEGKIRAIKYVREKKIPFLGICLGLQCAVIEIARNLCGLEDANSIEFDKNTKNPVIHFVEGQENIRKKSGTMRLGSFDCDLTKESIAYDLYKKKIISERHRHRYEVNPSYIPTLNKAQFKVSGINPDTGLVEIMELDSSANTFFIGTQFHGEFKSKLGSPHPTFSGLIRNSVIYNKEVKNNLPK
jgi:CTP synthase